MSPKPSAGNDARTDTDAPPTEKPDAYTLGEGETHVPADDAVILTDGGTATSNGTGPYRFPELPDFKRDILLTLARSGPTHGRGLLDDLEALRDETFSDSRLYPNLNALVRAGLVTKHENRHDDRSHEFALSQAGQQAVRDHAQRVQGAVSALDHNDHGENGGAR